MDIVKLDIVRFLGKGTNNKILINGEVPAFVVTVSGKKIANQNLKSGVYFVNVESETVKVVK